MANRTILPKHLDYTTLDQEAIERRLFRLVDTAFPEWSERSRINYGNMLLGAFAMVGDILTFLMDNHAKESRWSTARLRRSIRNHAKLIGYRLSSATAATVDVTITIPALANPFTIPAGERIVGNDVAGGAEYQLLTSVTFAPGETTKVGKAENSTTHVEVLVSDGRPDQVFQLARQRTLDGSMLVVAADGAYTEVTNFLDSTSTSRHFTTELDDQDRATIRFGDGVTGAIPIGTISVTYKTGGGKSGEVEAGALKRFVSSFFDTTGNPVTVSVTNQAAASSAEDRESNARARAAAPRSLRVQGRCVGREDYEIVAEDTPGVARALHLTGNENAAIGENQGQVFIVAEGGATPSQATLDAVAAKYDPITGSHPKTNTYQVLVAAAPRKQIDHQISVFLVDNTTAGRAATRAAIIAGLQSFYALTTIDETGEEVRNEAVDFGYYLEGPLAWSDVFNVVRDAAGVKRVDPSSGLLLNGLRDDVELLAQEFPELGDVTLIDASTGDAF